MSAAKKPIWVSPAAHARLVAYSAATGKTLPDAASALIIDGTSVAAEANPRPIPPAPAEDDAQQAWAAMCRRGVY